MNSFNTLKIKTAILNNLKKIGYITMTPIQEESIPLVLEGNDLLAQAKTGSGKTAAFGLGLLHHLDVELYRIQSLILCPTRELAFQVTEELRKLARFQHNIKILPLTGGLPLRKQENSLRHLAHIAVGTPGRVLKLLDRGALSLDHVKTLVLDEADRMLDMGFLDQIEAIVDYAPSQRQTLCFSATFPRDVKDLSQRILSEPKEITVESTHAASVIIQHFYQVPSEDKCSAVLSILARHRPESTVIFCNMKDTCRKVVRELNKAGLYALTIHGDLEQKERTETLVRFANRSSTVLVATDVAARGLHIEKLGAVINYDLPFETETYVHRIGRTGRAGAEGLAFSLMKPGEEYRIELINEYMNTEFSFEDLAMEPFARHPELEPPMVTLSINGGRKNKISPGDLLGALTAEGGISGDEVGKIDRLDYLTFVAVKRQAGDKALQVLSKGTIKGKTFKVLMNN